MLNAMSSPRRNVPCRGSCGRTPIVVLMAVLTVLAQTTHAQSYLLGLGKNQLPNYSLSPLFVGASNLELGSSQYHNQRTSLSEDQHATNATTSKDESRSRNQTTNFVGQDHNSTIILVKNFRENPSELSQTAMDIITIVWYVATFLALAAFFLLMACSDRRCADVQQQNNDTPIPPPTPSPSYSEFAPPSYETVMKMQHDDAAKTAIFVIPFGFEEDAKESNNNNSSSININNNNNGNTPDTPTTPTVNFYTVDELHKQGS